MRTLLAACLTLALLCQTTWADRILIYKGSQTNRSDYNHSSVLHFYLIFDIDSLQFVTVSYGGTGKHKSLTTGDPAAFVYDPVKITADASETIFATGTSNMVSPFELSFQIYSGRNAHLNPDLGLTGDFPKALSGMARTVQGDGTLLNGINLSSAATLVLDKSLTEQSDTSSDDLPTATGIVTMFLTDHGF